jgi:hypothetical protein
MVPSIREAVVLGFSSEAGPQPKWKTLLEK